MDILVRFSMNVAVKCVMHCEL